MSKYAVNTNVSVEKSQAEVQKILRKYNADRFGIMEDRENAFLMFEYNNLRIQMTVPLPDKEEFKKTETGRSRKANQIEEAFNQAVRQRWRALVLAIKAKLEAVEIGISTIEQEFMAFVMMPDGKQLSEHLLPQIKEIANTGELPKLLGFNS